MTDSFVRLNEISVQNFKNVKNGQLSFINKRKKYRSSVLGLYAKMVQEKQH